eukprot:TRINITY_DN10829_c0_g1_i2.p1 TRINITY_DN10829_c0_g1~~TRINITY_DN10829_c0_g1_i2.p1  ORF type:complete len:260 (-),score=55.17 TRINITY_DN10829_c0_g1_i2:32-811(-)
MFAQPKLENLASLTTSWFFKRYGEVISTIFNKRFKTATSSQDQVSASLDPLKLWLQKSGGLFLAHRPEMKQLFYKSHTFTASESWSYKGVNATLLDMDAYWPNKKLLIFNTHLDPLHQENQTKQLHEIRDFMSSVLDELFRSDIDLSQCGVLLHGDFNIGSESKKFQELESIIQGRDLYGEKITKTGEREHMTFDDRNPLVPHRDSRRIDYVFAFDSIGRHQLMPLQCLDFVISIPPDSENLSDHWPLQLTLLPVESDK